MIRGPRARSYWRKQTLVRTLITSLAAGVAALALVAVASATNPHEVPPVSLHCGADGSFQAMTVPGGGDFTPVHVVGGGTLIPVAFRNQVATFTDAEGNTTTENEPDVSHNAPANKHLLSCSFTFSSESPEGTFSFSGDVVAFVAPQEPSLSLLQ